MDTFSVSFDSFRSSFSKNELEECYSPLNECFIIAPKITLLRLYSGRYLENIQFLKILLSFNLPEPFRLLISILIQAEEDIESLSLFISGYSKHQILQGVANVLEKKNAELKYNQHWNVKFAGGNNRYLEAERQGMFVTTVGIAFQELLNRFYFTTGGVSNLDSKFDEDKLDKLLHSLITFNEVKDTLERHLFFDWLLEVDCENTLKTSAPVGQKEGTPKQDLINFQKLKLIGNSVESIATQKLINEYKSGLKEEKEGFKRFNKIISTIKSEKEKQWLLYALKLDILADQEVERELALYRRKYFPDMDNIAEIKFKDRSTLPIRPVFRILRFLAELSKEHIKAIDTEYSKAIIEYSKTQPSSVELRNIELAAALGKNDKHFLSEALSMNYNEQVFKEQQDIIRKAKSEISDSNCLIKIDIKKLVTTINLIHNYDIKFIEKVIEIFTFSEETKDVTRTPFFKIGGKLCWMPNSVAYVSFAENLIENLLSNKAISTHLIQTQLFEKSLNFLFLKYGYKIILQDKDRIFRDSFGKELGNFDVLAYKNGTLIYIEFKLTNTRNSYRDRKNWRETKLDEAKNQLSDGLSYINENIEQIRKILGLFENEQIVNIAPFIASNSFLYDHERIGGFLKVSYSEIMYALAMVERQCSKNQNDVDVFIDCLNNNRLFKKLEEIPLLDENVILKIGNYCLIRSGIIHQNIYTSI